MTAPCIQRFPLIYINNWNHGTISRTDHLFMTLMKLKLNCLNLDLAERFHITKTIVQNIVTTHILHYMRVSLKAWLRTGFLLCWNASHQCQHVLVISIAADLWLMLQRSPRISQGRIWWHRLKHIVPTKTVIQLNP